MTPDEPTLGYESKTSEALAYESNLSGALTAGEVLLWEDRPHLPGWEPQKVLLCVLTMLIAPALGGIVTWIATRGDMVVTVMLIGVAEVVAVIAIFMARQSRHPGRPDLPHVIYRITNRRIIRADDRPGKPHAATEVDSVFKIGTMRGKHPEITINHVAFEETPYGDDVLRHVLALWAKSGRRRKVRRTAVNDAIQPAPGEQAIPLPPGIVLVEGERVLWVGRPRVRMPFSRKWWSRQVVVLLWMLVPTGIVLSWLGMPRWVSQPHWGFVILAVLWLVLGIKSLTLNPLRDRRRREVTAYVLTNIRAIVHIADRSMSTNSALLDMVDEVTLETCGDGATNVWVGPSHFSQLLDADAARVHGIALNAVRAAGVPEGGTLKVNGLSGLEM